MSILEHLTNILKQNVNFSDILLKEGEPFKYRLPDGYHCINDVSLVDTDIKSFVTPYFKHPEELDSQIKKNGGHLDFAITVENVRFRCNVFHFAGSAKYGMSLRKLNDFIPPLETLALPPLAKTFADRATGLVLVTGATGSGKSTTQASMIDHINATRNSHIITIEDPIEYLHYNKTSSITQREVGIDVSSFAMGLKASLREDPDIILIGEIRDRETCEAALAAAETGHLVLATLHTASAAKSIERIMDMFHGDEKNSVRGVLSSVLVGIISQILVPLKDKTSRVLVAEVMANFQNIASTIRNDKLQSLNNEILQGIKEGQCLLNKELAKLVIEEKITKTVAENATYDLLGFQNEYKNTRKG